MATSLFFMPTDQNSVGNQNERLRINNHLGVANSSGEIRTTERQTQKSRGRRPGSKKGQQNQKKPTLRGMGVATLQENKLEAENRQLAATLVGDSSPNPNNAARLLPVPVVDPVLVLQGFPSSLGGCRNNRIYCGGVGSGQIMMDPVCPPWGFVETSPHHHELSSIPNPQMYNAISDPHCDTCFKKKRVDEDQNNVVRSNGGGFSKYTMVHPPMNGYEHLLQPDYQRSNQGFMYDHHHHRIARSAPPSAASTHPYLNEATNHTVSMEEYGSGYMEGNPRSGGSGGGVMEYEFFPGKYDDGFPGNYGKGVSSMATTSPNPSSSTIDLSLKL
ncbi:PREDICTED: protein SPOROCYTELESS-like [Camelina sativa]|uniref:Protein SPOROCYTELESS-like n=1 Tax=Camelina sativa TaxID=90675 RepID=A0ABM0UYF8_CAMSA|nr:PREDICTED: protein SPOROCYTELESS-like [Camelina sativa]